MHEEVDEVEKVKCMYGFYMFIFLFGHMYMCTCITSCQSIIALSMPSMSGSDSGSTSSEMGSRRVEEYVGCGVSSMGDVLRLPSSPYS